MSAKQWKPWVIQGGGALAASLAVAAYRGLFSGGAEAVWSALCDGCFVVGLLLVCLWALSFCAGQGMFDIFGYGVKSLKVLFTPFGKPETHQRYYDYKEEKAARRGKPSTRLLAIGLTLLAAALLFLALYSGAAPA